jgi:murein DD-endopeptidase MepM/ murein hydrolase activator NlpD
VSSTTARHRKPSRHSTRPVAVASARHRKRSLASSLAGGRPAVVVAVAGTTLVLGAGAAFAVTAWPKPPAHSSSGLTEALRNEAAGMSARNLGSGQSQDSPTSASASRPKPAAHAKPDRAAPVAARARHKPRRRKVVTAAAVYRNPLRDISGLIPERVDMGADFGGAGPIYAIGNAVVTNASGDNGGWPGGGWITYRLTSGPASGLQVYVAEDVRPAVQAGQRVSSGTVVANMFNGGDGIETGWAMPDGISAESQLPEAGAISGGGPFPTKVGLSFDSLLVTLGAPAAPNYGQSGYGVLPSNYPASWPSLRSKS